MLIEQGYSARPRPRKEMLPAAAAHRSLMGLLVHQADQATQERNRLEVRYSAEPTRKCF